MDTGDAHIVKPPHPVAEELEGQRSLFRHGNIRCARRHDKDRVLFEAGTILRVIYHPGVLIEFQNGHTGAEIPVQFWRGFSDKERIPAGDDVLGDLGDITVFLARREHYFGETLADGPVEIYLGETHIVEGKMLEFPEGRILGYPAVLKMREYFFYRTLGIIHDAYLLNRITTAKRTIKINARI